MRQEPNFKAFEDWLDVGPARRWPQFLEKKRQLTAEQQTIVRKNAELLLNKEAWSAHVKEFEEQLALIKDEKERSKKRAEFEIRFDRHSFLYGKANFLSLHFPCSVSFRSTKFGGGGVCFDGATFGEGRVSFAEATFGDGHVSFSGATFGKGLVTFSCATFGDGNVWFNGATFGDGVVWFQNIKLAETRISFEDIDVAGNLFFRETTFRKEANFQRASVKGTADFSGNTFHKVPDFGDTIFARPPEVAGMEVPPPQMKGNKALKIAKNKKDAAKYRQLKKMALAANDHEKGGEFFAYEMRAKRGCEKGSIEWYELLINSFYCILSNFGQSYWRPLVCLGLSSCGFFLYYAISLGQLFITDERMTFAFWHSLRNTLPFVSSLFRFANKPKDFLLWYDRFFKDLAEQKELVETLVNASIIQNFIGLILLFLLLLGLRNKFRLK